MKEKIVIVRKGVRTSMEPTPNGILIYQKIDNPRDKDFSVVGLGVQDFAALRAAMAQAEGAAGRGDRRTIN